MTAPVPDEGYRADVYARDEKRPTKADTEAFDADVALELTKLKVRDAAKAIFTAEKAALRTPEPFDAGTLAEILARPPEPLARIEGLLPWEAGMLLIAQRKTGKTTFLLNLARSLLDRRAVPQPIRGAADRRQRRVPQLRGQRGPARPLGGGRRRRPAPALHGEPPRPAQPAQQS